MSDCCGKKEPEPEVKSCCGGKQEQKPGSSCCAVTLLDLLARRARYEEVAAFPRGAFTREVL